MYLGEIPKFPILIDVFSAQLGKSSKLIKFLKALITVSQRHTPGYYVQQKEYRVALKIIGASHNASTLFLFQVSIANLFSAVVLEMEKIGKRLTNSQLLMWPEKLSVKIYDRNSATILLDKAFMAQFEGRIVKACTHMLDVAETYRRFVANLPAIFYKFTSEKLFTFAAEGWDNLITPNPDFFGTPRLFLGVHTLRVSKESDLASLWLESTLEVKKKLEQPTTLTSIPLFVRR